MFVVVNYYALHKIQRIMHTISRNLPHNDPMFYQNGITWISVAWSEWNTSQ